VIAGIGRTRIDIEHLVPALLTTGITLLTSVFTRLVHEPASIATLIGIVVISVVLDMVASRMKTPAPAAI
jgi:hypothetical protein